VVVGAVWRGTGGGEGGVSELLSGDVSLRAQVGGNDFSRDPESFDAELDACLDRALTSEPSEDIDLTPEPTDDAPLNALLDLASTEASWLESLPPPSNDNVESSALTLSDEAANVVIPEWLRAEAPASESSCGTVAPWEATPWSMSGAPADAYARPAWTPVSLPVEPEEEMPPPAIAEASTRILGLSPLSFVSAVAMGALAAGLLVVTGLRLTSKESAPTVQATPPAAAIASLPVPSPVVAVVAPAAPAVIPAAPVAPNLPQALTVDTPALTDAQRAAQALTPNAPVLAGSKTVGLTTGLQTVTPDFKPAPVAVAPKKKAPRAETLETPEDSGEVREMSFGSEISEEELAQARQARAEAEAEEAAPPESEIDEDFARELGFTDDAEAAPEKKTREKTVYVPPAPTTTERERLLPADVTQVVVSHQSAITTCVQNFKAGTPLENGGRFQLRWSVDTAGTVSGVAMETDTLRGSPLATCVEDQVRGWKFPVHRVAMDAPVRFPFVI
jgi:hypothetical protein